MDKINNKIRYIIKTPISIIVRYYVIVFNLVFANKKEVLNSSLILHNKNTFQTN